MLLNCLDKIGKLLPSLDREDIAEAFQKHVDAGLSEQEAGLQALADFHERLAGEQNELRTKAGVKAVDVARAGVAEPAKSSTNGVSPLKSVSDSDKDRKVLNFAQQALEAKAGGKTSISLGEVSRSNAEQVLNATGQNIAGYERVIDNYAVKHVIRKHGGADEALRGQIPVTADDIALIPKIVAEPDRIENAGKTPQGRNTILYVKRLNGDTYYFEEIRTGRKQLVPTTLYKRASSDSPTSHVQNVFGDEPRRVNAESDDSANDTTESNILRSTATGTAPTLERDGKVYEQRPVLVEELLKREPAIKDYIMRDRPESNPEPGRDITEPIVIGQKPRGGIVIDGLARIAQAISNGQRMIPAFVEPIEALRSVSPSLNEWKTAHTEDLLSAQTGGELKGRNLNLNEADAEELRRMLGEQHYRTYGVESPQSAFDGATWGPAQIRAIIDLAKEKRQELRDVGYTEEQLAGRDQLYKNLDKLLKANENHSVTYVYESALRHEETHREDLDAGQTTEEAAQHIQSSPFVKSPGFVEDYGHLSPINQASEVAALLLNGEESKYGWDQHPDFEDEKNRVLGHWADGIVENNADFIRENGWDAFAQKYERIASAHDQYAKDKSSPVTETEGSQASDAVPTGSGRAARPPTDEQGSDSGRGETTEGENGPEGATGSSRGRGESESELNPRSKVGKDMEARAIEQGLVSTFGGTAEYEKINLKALAANATNLINKDLPRALRIIHGQEDAPKGLTNQAVFNALDTYANETKNTALQIELANSEHASGTSKVAQAMRLMRERDPYSAVSLIQQVQEARSAKVSPKRQTKLMDNEIQKIDSQVKQSIKINQASWQKFVKSIEC